MLVPKLRFKREDGTSYSEWEEKKIGDILTLCHGKDYKHLENGDIPVMGTGGVITYVNKALCDWECVCIGRKGTIDKPYYMNKPFWSVDTLFYSKPLGNNMPKFQYYLFQNINWYFYNEASGVPSLSASTIENIKSKVPCLEEQQKIADFLSAVDEVIAQSEAEVQNLEQQKKAAMQKIFSQEVRFKREDGTEYPEWEECTLGDIGEVAMCKRILKEQTSEQGDVPFFKISTFGSIPDAFISFELYKTFKNEYRFPKKGAILISAAGTIGKTVRYNGEDAYYQDSNIVWLEHNDNVSDDFLYQFYQQVTWEGLEGSTIKRLYNKNLLEAAISLPSLEEQQKIADFLSAYDEAISYAKQELDKWKELKKGLLQQMFV